jgi:deferrochelatase/peroxidase EfeB
MPLNLDSNFGAIDQDSSIYQDFLEDLQGNILNGHGRDHAVHIFIAFIPEKNTEVKSWISSFANTITSAKSQLESSSHYKLHQVDGGVFRNEN